jgi:hypothetical protein
MDTMYDDMVNMANLPKYPNDKSNQKNPRPINPKEIKQDKGQ